MDRKTYGLAGAAIGFAIVIFCAVLWQPDRQIRLHQKHLLKSVEKRDWDRFTRFVADDYSDRWGHDKTFVLRESREVFRQFIFLTVRQEERTLRTNEGSGIVEARVMIEGRGGPLAEFAMQRVNALAEPFRFRWQQKSWKPWDWQLVEFDQPELEIPNEWK